MRYNWIIALLFSITVKSTTNIKNIKKLMIDADLFTVELRKITSAN